MSATNYWDTLVEKISAFFASLPFSGATWFVLANLVFFIWLFAKADKNPTNPVHWEHLIVDSNNNRASPYKVGYIVGLIVSSWIVITLIDKGRLTFDMFGVYLSYLLGGAGVNSFAKRGQNYNSYGDNYNSYNNQYGQPNPYGQSDPYSQGQSDPYGQGNQPPQHNVSQPQNANAPGGPPPYGPPVQGIDTN